ncbi:DUF6904 family protein [Pseudomonas aeruginosa]|uniref:DUF6904 family protein n=1 Tax=Pseudomonas aeruginosa TaxID=287 RepID=UPI0015F06600|nr:hypothetical protein [Pseudomonas aeruginosa]MBA4878200.1 hypothetical protein [Pseudomonas aeruginosa]MBA4890467.1 hypothetical protein [Pseudomonas aeruginosa]
MLEYKLTPHHAGVALWGDFAALDKLHEFIHHVVEESVYIEDKEGFVLGLAYDVRKAFQGQRTQGYRSYSEDDKCRIYGVEVLWPVLLVQVGVLRQAMAFIPTSKLKADEVIQQIRHVGSTSYLHLDSMLDSRCRYFISLPANQRLKTLPKLMETFNPMYGFLAKSDMRPGIIPPSAFVEDGQEWPDFKW